MLEVMPCALICPSVRLHSPLSTPLSAGGIFTRQADVTFQPGGEKLTINQEFKGIDEHDHLVVNTRLEGSIPQVPEGATVQIDPYYEIYQYSSNRESALGQQGINICIVKESNIIWFAD